MSVFLYEDDDITMDIQVGPEEEIEAEVDEDETPCCTPVDCIKQNVASIPIAGIEKEGIEEFYVEASDVARYADLNEISLVEALNDIIEFHEDSEIDSSNLIVVMDESTADYAPYLAECNIICAFTEDAMESDDIDIDIQVGPNEEELSVGVDSQEANPVDAVKREYDNVIVARDGDEFFTDVEDVQKCADINCESVIETLNNIIEANGHYGMNTDNLVVIVNESTDLDVIDELQEAGVLLEAQFHFFPKFARIPEMKNYLRDLKTAEDLLNANAIDADEGTYKYCALALRIISIMWNIGGCLSLPLCLTIIGIPVHLIQMGSVYAVECGEEDLVIREGKRVITKYNSLINHETDSKKKKALIDARDKLIDSLEKFEAKK